MTWQIGVFVVFRVLCALPALRWPFAGGLFAILTDFSDLFLMNAIGGIEDYQRLDKLCDLAYMLVFLRVALGWAGLERGVCLLYTSDAADERSSVDLGGRRII